MVDYNLQIIDKDVKLKTTNYQRLRITDKQLKITNGRLKITGITCHCSRFPNHLFSKQYPFLSKPKKNMFLIFDHSLHIDLY